MPGSRFTQYGAAVGAEDALKQMVAERIAAQQAEAKQQQLEIETAMRAHQLGQGDERIGLDREQLGLQREQFEQSKQPKPQGPMTLSPGASMVDPSTGRIIATAPSQEKPAGPMNLGPGAVIADPTTGRIIVRNPQQAARSPEEDLRTFEAKEQIKAKYGGSRPSLGAERNILMFYNRAKEASENIGGMEDDIAKMGLPGQTWLNVMPNFAQPERNQIYRQAQRAFTEARLRKESGAAIPQGEYDNDARTYFAQPGDTPQVLEQKRRGRQTVIEGLKFGAGKAYDEFYGASGAQETAPARTGVSIKSIRQVR